MVEFYALAYWYATCQCGTATKASDTLRTVVVLMLVIGFCGRATSMQNMKDGEQIILNNINLLKENVEQVKEGMKNIKIVYFST